MQSALRHAPGIDARDFRRVGSQSVLAVKARQLGTRPRRPSPTSRAGSTSASSSTRPSASARSRAATTRRREVWRALATEPGLAVVDATVAPRRDNFNFAVLPDFQLTGFYLEDGVFDPVPLTVRDPQTGRSVRLKVIGVLKDTAPLEMAGISTSQATLRSGRSRGRVRADDPLLRARAGRRPGDDGDEARIRVPAERHAGRVDPAGRSTTPLAANRTFNRLIQGFMGLGLIVGVAALGVISARAVVERRQQIGVLRAIGFRRGMVQAVFLIESSFIALTSIVVGTALGLVLAENIISDSRKQPSWENLTLVVPWVSFARRLLDRLRRRARGDAGARSARVADQARRGAAVPVSG